MKQGNPLVRWLARGQQVDGPGKNLAKTRNALQKTGHGYRGVDRRHLLADDADTAERECVGQ